ncbi:MAG: site-specific DNA-methyltransferase [Nitrospirales bacterium]
MQKFTAADPETKSSDIKAENLDTLRALFPELVTEGPDGVAVNVDVLKQLVGDQTVTDPEEKFGLNWLGKRRAGQLALTLSTGTLRPRPEEGVDWDTTQNVMIEGDNLEVLKLLQKSYAGKVKLIYIDPPYNTGSDFVYPDDFRDSIGNYLVRTGQIESDGRKNSSNTEASGRFHTDWLNMIFPRLKLAWRLLRPDGFLLASIDDREYGHLRTVLNELYGEENFVATLVFDRNRKNDAKLISAGHEYMILYARNKQFLAELDVRLRAPKDGVDEVRDLFAELRQKHGDDWKAISAGLKEHYATFTEDDPRLPLARFSKVDERGPFREDGDASWPGGGGPRYDVPHPITGRPCTVPSRGWVWPTYERMKEEIDRGEVIFGRDEKRIPSIRRNLFDKDDQVLRSVIFSYAQKASQDFAALFDGEAVFQNPKSYKDMHRLVAYLTEPGDIVLDFFAGSGTTGHGTMLARSEGEPSRRFILVQLQELLDPNDKEQKIAAQFCASIGRPQNIAELTKERLRRAGKKIKEESPIFTGDLGFRVFKLDSTNIRAWEPDREKLPETLEASVEHLKTDRTEQDILFELLLKLGLDLCVPIETKTIAKHEVHSIGAGTIFVCLSTSIPQLEVEPLALGIVAWLKMLAPAGDTTCVFRDSAFGDDVAKTNLTAILNQHGLETVRSL